MEPNDLIEKIFSSNMIQDENGNSFKLAGSIDRTEGDYIYSIINENKKITRTLEIGCGYGISSLFICSAMNYRENAKHTIIDPYQYSDYNGIGIANLKRINCTNFNLIEEQSEFALPELAKTQAGSFDFILIDGWHSFDHTLLDLFYSNLLLKIGGYLVVDDCRLPSVATAVAYFSKYPAYKIFSEASNSNLSFKGKFSRRVSKSIPAAITRNILPPVMSGLLNRTRYSSMITLMKLNQDQRNSRWYCNFL
jgi:predicted O-methyltransferase YrrM